MMVPVHAVHKTPLVGIPVIKLHAMVIVVLYVGAIKIFSEKLNHMNYKAQ